MGKYIETFPELIKATNNKMGVLPIPKPRKKRKNKSVMKRKVQFVVTVSRR